MVSEPSFLGKSYCPMADGRLFNVLEEQVKKHDEQLKEFLQKVEKTQASLPGEVRKLTISFSNLSKDLSRSREGILCSGSNVAKTVRNE